MKHLPLFLLLLITACVSKTQTPAATAGSTNENEVVSELDFRKDYLAGVLVEIKVKKDKITFKESDSDSDRDQDFECSVDVADGFSFNYVLENGVLTLRNAQTIMIFNKIEGSNASGLLGKWQMIETPSKKVKIITEMNFESLKKVEIRKTCLLK